MAQIKQSTVKFQALWRKALREGEVQLDFPDVANLHRCRFALYNAVRRVRGGVEMDQELLEATEQVVMQVRGLSLFLTTKADDAIMQVVGQALKGDEELLQIAAPISAEEQAMAESLARTLKLLEEPAPEHTLRRANPYYTRED